jgi:hypothetical protein
MHNGSTSFIVNQSAVEFIRYAFAQLGFVPGDRENKSYLNCVVKNVYGVQEVVGGRKISYSHATAQLRKAVRDIGREAEGITDKSFKMQGVTAILDSGIPLEDVIMAGGVL